MWHASGPVTRHRVVAELAVESATASSGGRATATLAPFLAVSRVGRAGARWLRVERDVVSSSTHREFCGALLVSCGATGGARARLSADRVSGAETSTGFGQGFASAAGPGLLTARGASSVAGSLRADLSIANAAAGSGGGVASDCVGSPDVRVYGGPRVIRRHVRGRHGGN